MDLIVFRGYLFQEITIIRQLLAVSKRREDERRKKEEGRRKKEEAGRNARCEAREARFSRSGTALRKITLETAKGFVEVI